MSTYFEFHDTASNTSKIAVTIRPYNESLNGKLKELGGRFQTLGYTTPAGTRPTIRAWVVSADKKSQLLALIPGRVTDLTAAKNLPDWQILSELVVTKISADVYEISGATYDVREILKEAGARGERDMMGRYVYMLECDTPEFLKKMCEDIESKHQIRVVHKDGCATTEIETTENEARTSSFEPSAYED